jgi:hypothetical protein
VFQPLDAAEPIREGRESKGELVKMKNRQLIEASGTIDAGRCKTQSAATLHCASSRKVETNRLLCRLGQLLICVLLLATVKLGAQVTTADIVGTVTDATGAVISGASVTALNVNTGITRTTTSGASGDFVFNLLPVGQYTVSVKAPTFEGFKQNNIVLTAGDRTRVNAELAVGNIQDVVQINDVPPTIQTDSSSLGTVMTTKAVEDLPLNGRNFISLVQLVPGVTSGIAGGGQALNSGTRPDDRRQSSAFSTNGQDPDSNNNLIDGADNNDRLIGAIGVRPSIDAISEVKVETNLYSAEVGRTAGGVVNILTKSGSNNLHGSVFEFLRNDILDANSFYNFTNQATVPRKPEYRQNQFGGSIGGPIRRNKTFFFGDFEALRIVQGGNATGVVVPTALQRVGNFSESCTAGFGTNGICANSAQQISLTRAFGTAPAGPIPYNRLDQAPYSSSLDPIGLKLAALYPLPSSSAITAGNYTALANRTYYSRTYDIKIDHHFNDANMMWGRYSYNLVSTLVPTLFPDVSGGFNPGSGVSGIGGTFPGPNVSGAMNGALDYIHIFSPTLLLDLSASYLRNAINSRNINYGKNVANTLGFPCTSTSCINTGNPQTYGLPQIAPQGFQTIGDASYTPLSELDNSYLYKGSLTWTHGRHNVKVGGGFIRRQFTDMQSTGPRGTFTFVGATASVAVPVVNGTAVGSTTLNDGAGLANLLLGSPSALSRSLGAFASSYRTWEPGGYVQDDWHAIRRLTLNLGVRYDVFTPKVEVHDRIGNLNIFTGQVLVPGMNTSRTTGLNTVYSDVAPRVGFAITLGHEMVVRGGYGISYFPGDINSGALLKNPPYTPSVGCGPSTGTACSAYGSFGTLDQGMPVPAVSVVATTTPAGLSSVTILPGTSITEIEQNFAPSYIQQYNLIVEKGIGKNTVSAGYIGTVGRQIAMNPQDINRALPSGTATANPRPITQLNPNIGTVTAWLSEGRSAYNALQLTFQRRVSNGINVNSGYTFAKETDDVNAAGNIGSGGYNTLIGPQAGIVANIQKYDHSAGDFDVKHRFYAALNYAPTFFDSVTGYRAVVAKGWQANAVLTWQTGVPYTVTNATGRTGIIGLASGERPDRVKASLKASTPAVGTSGYWLDTTAWSSQALYTLGNSARNVGYGPGATIVNLSLFKTFVMPKKTNIEFRSEFFNIFNHPTFSNPVTTLGSGNFGQITSVAAGSQPRQIQFALKYIF